jgi:uncharacterized protein
MPKGTMVGAVEQRWGRRDAVDTVVGFARTLRAAGVVAGPDRVHQFVRALEVLDPGRRDHVYWAGRTTLCGDPDDLERYDRAFAAYFSGLVPPPVRRPPPAMHVTRRPVGVDYGPPPNPGRQEDVPVSSAEASTIEVLRHRDFAGLDERERVELARILAAFRLAGETRRSRRWRAAPRGRIDRAHTVRELLRRGGEPAPLRHQAHPRRPRRVVLLVDVSGSMSPYAGALLRFAHAAGQRGGQGSHAEVFTIGTRLTCLTREMAHRDPETALAAVADAVPDWSGGTRLGVLLKEFNDRYGQRGVARGAIVVILSDGWERGDTSMLGEQMARLSRLAHRVVWANPRKGHAGYQPLAGGIAAALPYVDDFVEGHSLLALERLARVVAGDQLVAGRRRLGGPARA